MTERDYPEKWHPEKDAHVEAYCQKIGKAIYQSVAHHHYDELAISVFNQKYTSIVLPNGMVLAVHWQLLPPKAEQS